MIKYFFLMKRKQYTATSYCLALIIVIMSASRVSAYFQNAQDGSKSEIETIRTMEEKYRRFIIPDAAAFNSPLLKSVYKEKLLPMLIAANEDAKKFDFQEDIDKLIILDEHDFYSDQNPTTSKIGTILSKDLPLLGISLILEVPEGLNNPYYHNAETKRLILKYLDYLYQRGVNEEVWTNDHNGHISKMLLNAGMVRPSGDLSRLGLRTGGYSTTVFLVKEILEEEGLLEKYVAIAKRITCYSEELRSAFPGYNPELESVLGEIPENALYYLNADGFRVFMDNYIPLVFLLANEENAGEHLDRIRKVISKSLRYTPPGVDDTVKPDGLGFHHLAVYLGAYCPHTYTSAGEAFYLFHEFGLVNDETVQAIKHAVLTYRLCCQKYDMMLALQGRGLNVSGTGGVIKAMAYIASNDGLADGEMKKAWSRMIDGWTNNNYQQLADHSRNRYPVLGIFRIVDDLLEENISPEPDPSGNWAKNYGPLMLHRRDNWLASVKGFSKYFWTAEGPIYKKQNSFGQQMSHGTLQILAQGEPVNLKASGTDIENGWDWYHNPGATALHLPIVERSLEEFLAERSRNGSDDTKEHRQYNSRTFVGGLSLENRNGIFAMDFEDVPVMGSTNLTARKSYFFFNDLVVALGTDINGGDNRHNVHTTLFQTFLPDKSVKTSLNDREIDTSPFHFQIAGDTTTLADASGNSYLVIDPALLVFKRVEQKSLTPDHKKTKGYYASAWINHGKSPLNDQYEYAILIRDTDKKINDLAENSSGYYEVLSRVNGLHMVRYNPEEITAYAFYQANMLPLNGIVRSVNMPVLVMTRNDGNKVVLSVCMPDHGWVAPGGEETYNFASTHYKKAKVRQFNVRIELNGQFKITTDTNNVRVRIDGPDSGITILEVNCRDAENYELVLEEF